MQRAAFAAAAAALVTAIAPAAPLPCAAPTILGFYTPACSWITLNPTPHDPHHHSPYPLANLP